MVKPRPTDLVLAPLTLLERSRGWKRRALTLLYLTIALTVGVFVWREVSLWGLPKAPEPFDLVKYGRVEVDVDDNAVIAYREVFSRFGDLDTKSYNASDKAWQVADWSAADPEVRRWAEDHRSALAAWLPANDRPDALLVQPKDMRLSTRLDPAQQLRAYVRLALLEGSRLEQSDHLAGAWRMYRAALRASRHVGRHAAIIPRLIGSVFLRETRPRIDAWIDRPGMTPELLRRAMSDIEACRAMTSPASEMVRAEYFSARDSVNDTDLWPKLTDSGPYSRTDWTNQFSAGRWARKVLRREPERSARVLRLVTAGYLAQCDRPLPLRARLLFPHSMIYARDAQTPRAVRAISPEALESWWKDSILSELTPFSNILQGYVDGENGTLDHFTLKMAERAFLIEHGRPPKTYGELLGPYLKMLPEGIDPEEVLDPGSG
jgi:hypothetical protein